MEAAQAAFKLLRHASAHTNRKCRKNAIQSINQIVDMAEDDALYSKAAPVLTSQILGAQCPPPPPPPVPTPMKWARLTSSNVFCRCVEDT